MVLVVAEKVLQAELVLDGQHEGTVGREQFDDTFEELLGPGTPSGCGRRVLEDPDCDGDIEVGLIDIGHRAHRHVHVRHPTAAHGRRGQRARRSHRSPGRRLPAHRATE